MTTDAQRVLARGAEVQLADGQTYVLKFDLEAVEHLETQWGGLADFLDAFGEVVASGWKGPRAKVARTAVEAGLLHLGIAPLISRALVTPATLRPPSPLMVAIGEALDEAFPVTEDAGQGKGSAEESDLTGPGSTTSAPSASVAATVPGAA